MQEKTWEPIASKISAEYLTSIHVCFAVIGTINGIKLSPLIS